MNPRTQPNWTPAPILNQVSERTQEAPRIELLSELFDAERLGRLGIDVDSAALFDSTTTLTWAEAADRIARLATLLTAAAVQPGDRVGVRMMKCVDSFVAVHAILRCGAVMVPLDPTAPTEQSVRVITDADIAVIIADRRARLLGEIVDNTTVSTSITVDGDAVAQPGTEREIEMLGADALAAAVPVEAYVRRASSDPAYIIYTSGSTGQPKGIVHSHASGLAYAEAAAKQYDLNPFDRLANIAPLHFDQSTFELYAAPLVGAPVLVVPDAVLRFPASLSELISNERITVWYSVPYLLEQLSTRGALSERDLRSLRWVLYGGESFPHDQLAQLMQQLPRAVFSNVYGPAEVNQCTVFDLREPPTDVVPIGRAWDRADVLLVDPEDHDVTVTGPGTGLLLVASHTMMTGYWNRPDLTAAAIVERDGRRWYNTGDRIERRADDGLVFLGRADNQVKVRGYRIELEAVDTALRAHDTVAAATTVVQRTPGGDDTVVALVTFTGSDDVAGQIARVLDHVRRALPRYAVPAEVIVVDGLPRTGTGKVDRIAAGQLLARHRKNAEAQIE